MSARHPDGPYMADEAGAAQADAPTGDAPGQDVPDEGAVEALRLNKAIARAGVASRREADHLVRQGRVRLNGAVVLDLAQAVVPGRDRLEVDGRTVPLAAAPAREVWALYKPKRVVSTLHDPEGRTDLSGLLPRSAKVRLFPIGRLDYDAEGLILLTNDGDLAHQVAHPTHRVDKVYLVKVKGLVESGTLARLARGPVLEGRRRQPVKARVLHTVNDKTWVEVVLHEGIQHHIKKMFAAEGHRVLKIKRYQVGGVELGDLEPGRARRLSKAEIATLLPAGARRPSRRRARPAHGG